MIDENRIQTLSCRSIISLEHLPSEAAVTRYEYQQMAQSLAEELLNSGLLKIEHTEQTNIRFTTATLIVLKP